jgi:hypothetical protein
VRPSSHNVEAVWNLRRGEAVKALQISFVKAHWLEMEKKGILPKGNDTKKQ